MATFTPKPLKQADPVSVTIALAPELHQHLAMVGEPHGLTVEQVLEQFISWACETKTIAAAPAKKRTRKIKTEA